jgi:glycine/D-amino acid oxidase-like deaminating enzyme
MSDLGRRDVLVAALGASMAALVGSACERRRGVPDGELIDLGGTHAHGWLREGLEAPARLAVQWDTAPVLDAQVAIVGAGIAGLSAAYRLRKAGLTDVALVELDEAPGGTARSARSPVTAFPLGAHYVVAPDQGFPDFEALLRELGAFDGQDEQGRPLVAESAACREPEERHFRDGRFHPGLYPSAGETAEERHERQRFATLLAEHAARVDDAGLRWFALPARRASRSDALCTLDRQSFADFLDQQGIHSWRLRWLCEYACRDDYGTTLATTSARAGLLYFCARRAAHAAAGDVDGGRTVITWPEGNGRIVQHLLSASGARVLLNRAVLRVSASADGNVELLTLGTDGPLRIRAPQAVVAVPGFVAARILPGREALPVPTTSPWAVVNLHLRQRPNDRGSRFPAPMPWDTVFTQSASLGYVVATHQRGSDHGPTVLTWYRPLTESEPQAARRQLFALGRAHWAEAALSELSLAHPDIRAVVSRVDVARIGHGMVRPVPGLWADTHFHKRAEPLGNIFLAHTDLSGVALFEEAFATGVEAAEGVLRTRGARAL